MTRVPFESESERAANAPLVSAHLRTGGLIAYPTETVYGFGCAVQPDALERLAALKGRGAEKRFLLLIRSQDDVPGLRWNDAARHLAQAFWPGPLTLALGVENPEMLPSAIVGPEGTVAVRSSPHPAVRAILASFGAPITSTSANRSGAPPAADPAEAAAALRELDIEGQVWLLDGGPLPVSAPSTLVDCSQAPPRVVREGALPEAQLRRVLEETDVG